MMGQEIGRSAIASLETSTGQIPSALPTELSAALGAYRRSVARRDRILADMGSVAAEVGDAILLRTQENDGSPQAAVVIAGHYARLAVVVAGDRLVAAAGEQEALGSILPPDITAEVASARAAREEIGGTILHTRRQRWLRLALSGAAAAASLLLAWVALQHAAPRPGPHLLNQPPVMWTPAAST